MKLSELRPCDSCGGQLSPCFYVVRISAAMRDTGQVLGVAQYFQGGTDAVCVFGDEDPSLWTELVLCQECCVRPHLGVLLMVQHVSEQTQAGGH